MSCCFSNELCNLIGRKAIIHTGRCSFTVVISNITPCYVKAIEVRSGNIKIFNLDHIDFIEECSC